MDLETLKKIKALAERGHEGEKEAAQRMLDRMMAKLDVDPSALEEKEEPRLVQFNYRDDFEKQILFQVYAKVMDSGKIHYSQYKARTGMKRRTVGLTITPAQEDEIRTLFAIYRKAFREELTRCLDAFIQVNQIFPTTRSSEPREVTPEERRKIDEMLRMMRAMKKVKVPLPNHLRIGNGE